MGDIPFLQNPELAQLLALTAMLYAAAFLACFALWAVLRKRHGRQRLHISIGVVVLTGFILALTASVTLSILHDNAASISTGSVYGALRSATTEGEMLRVLLEGHDEEFLVEGDFAYAGGEMVTLSCFERDGIVVPSLPCHVVK